MRAAHFAIAAAVTASLTVGALGQSTWTGAGDGTTWTSPANWAGGVPGPATNVTITSGTPTISAAAAVGGFAITGGTLTLNAPLTINGVASFSTINTVVGPADITLSPTASLTLNAGLVRQVDVSLVNHGTIELFNGSVLSVNGTFSQSNGGVVRTHVDGVALSQLGRIAAAGPASVGGAVRVVYDNSFAPSDCIFTYTILTSQQLTPQPGLVLTAPVTLPISASIRVRPSSLRLDPKNLADVAGLGGSIGADGLITADDVIVFLDRFFAQDLSVADVAQLGGTAGADGLLTADDVIVFLGALLSGTCVN